MNHYILLLIILTFTSCTRFSNNKQDPLVKVYNNHLYKEDITGIFPLDVSKTDSINIVRNYIDKWIINQLFLRLAEMNLPEEEKNLDKQITDFRSSLLIFKYQQHLLSQKLDSIITLKELEEYYETHGNNFILDKPAIRGIYLKVPVNSPNLERLLPWFRNDDDFIQIENFSNQYAVTNAFFIDNWIYLDNVLRDLPAKSHQTRDNITNIDHIIANDSEYHYFIGIRDYKPARSQMPFSLASHKIKNIILNKRKIQFLNDLEKNVLNEGLSKNTIQYF